MKNKKYLSLKWFYLLGSIGLFLISKLYWNILSDSFWKSLPEKSSDSLEGILRIDVLLTVLYGIGTSALVLLLSFFKELKSIERNGLKFICLMGTIFFLILSPLVYEFLGKSFISLFFFMFIFGSFIVGIVFESKI